jgi:hypothetical protein
MADAATTSLALLDDPTKYVAGARQVAIFKPHSRTVTVKGPDGNPQQKTVVVDKAKLGRILANMVAELQQRSKPVEITPGHTLPDPKTPEGQQPPVWGWGLNYRIEPFGDGSELAISYDEYIRKDVYEDERDGYKTYPFRSAEFYADSEEIPRIVLLRRDPALSLGAVIYSTVGGRDLWRYSMGADNMADTTIVPPAPPDAGKDQQDTAFKEQMMRCMKACYPKFDEMYMKMAAPPAATAAVPPVAPVPPAAPIPNAAAPAAAAPAMPSATNISLPAETPKKKEEEERVDNAQVTQLSIQYAKLQTDVAALLAEKTESQAERAKLAAERQLARAEKNVAILNGEGFYFRDPAKEVAKFVELDEAAAKERMDEIRSNYQRDPVAASQQTIPVATERAGKAVLTEQRLEVAQRYMREGKSWEEAEKLALAS